MPRSKRPKKSTAGMRRTSDGKVRYSARDAKGRFVSRKTTERVYYPQNGELIKAGIGVSRADSKSGRKSQATGGQTIEAQTYVSNDIKQSSGVIYNENGEIESYYGKNPKDIVNDIYDDPIMHETFSGSTNETLKYDNTNMGRWREKAREYIDVDKERSTDNIFVYDPAANAKWKIGRKEQEEAYKIFKEANKIVEQIREMTDADMHEDVIASKFSYNMNVNPDVLYRRVDAAQEIIDKGARQYVIDVAAKYRQDFTENFKDQFEAEDIKEFMEAIDALNDRQFLSVLKYASKSNLAYVIQSVIDEYGYEYALGEIKALTQQFREYKTNDAFREDVRWKNWKKK